MHAWPMGAWPTWWGAGSVEGGTGAGSIGGATGLSLVEGPFQLPPPLDPVVLLTEILEDLLCGRGNKNKEVSKEKCLRYSSSMAQKPHCSIDSEMDKIDESLED